jgi:hypothetical protein
MVDLNGGKNEMKYKLVTTDDFISQELPKHGIPMQCFSLGDESYSKESYNLHTAQKIRDDLIKENPFFSRISIHYENMFVVNRFKW